MKTFEVEIKFQTQDIAALEKQLLSLGSTGFGLPMTEMDRFYQHPCRNFVETDECLRLRQRIFPDGASQFCLTYKGPKIDTETKTREEIEMPITDPKQVETLLTALGFIPSASMQKIRRRMSLLIENRYVDIVLDTLMDLPEASRNFVEIETLATESEVDACRLLLFRIAHQLGLTDSIRESYLKLVQKHLSGMITVNTAEPPL